MYFSPEQAREIARRRKVVAEYVPRSGARCIWCGEWGDELSNGGYQTLVDGTRRKYLICPTCGNKFIADLPRNITDDREDSRTTPA